MAQKPPLLLARGCHAAPNELLNATTCIERPTGWKVSCNCPEVLVGGALTKNGQNAEHA